MKLYRIKLMGADMYIRGIMIDTKYNVLHLTPMLAFFDEEAAIYEEDKALKYVEQLNKQESSVSYIAEPVEE